MLKITNYTGQPHMDDLNRLVGAVEELIESGGQGEQGERGDDGDNGWTPVFAIVEREDDAVMQITEYVGGTGLAPINNVGKYVGSTGLVTDILDAVNIRGLRGFKGDAGENGTDGADGVDGEDGADGVGVPAGGNTGEILVKLSDSDFDTGWAIGGSGGASSLLELDDTPNSYGTNGQYLSVQVAWDGSGTSLVWTSLPNFPTNLTDLNDTPSSLGSDGQVLVSRFDMNTFQMGTVWEDLPTGTGGAESFLELNDTPSAYADNAGKVVAVNSAEDGLEFIDAPTGGGGGGGIDQSNLVTWTPSFVDSSGNPIPNIQEITTRGWYLRHGDMVYFQLFKEWRNGDNETLRVDYPIPPHSVTNVSGSDNFTVGNTNRLTPNQVTSARGLLGQIRFYNLDGQELNSGTGSTIRGLMVNGSYLTDYNP